MFGPLNSVRTALVVGAVLAAIVAFATGRALVGLVLLAGVAIHGLGWLYLYSTARRESETESSGQ